MERQKQSNTARVVRAPLQAELRRNKLKNLLKLSALAAVLVVSATYASAATITINSGGSATGPYTNGTLQFLGYNAAPGTTYPGSLTYSTVVNGAGFGATTATTDILPGSVWAGPIGSSSWVSFTTTGPGGDVPNNGDYVYETTFDTTSLGAGPLAGSLDILADDTVSVFLNGTGAANEIETAGGVGGDGDCSSGQPSCTSNAGSVYNFSGLNNGVNTLYFVVEQTGSASEGLDFTVSASPVPEPSTLLMLGTGLMGSAGALFRRMRSK